MQFWTTFQGNVFLIVLVETYQQTEHIITRRNYPDSNIYDVCITDLNMQLSDVPPAHLKAKESRISHKDIQMLLEDKRKYM